MKHRIILLAFTCLILHSPLSTLRSQELPQGYFRNPLDFDIGLSATFAELRAGHFHAGIDMRTGGATGKAVHAVADGYVCGIRISPWGGGKMLYVKHPNGYTSVYMHLDSYEGDIGRWVLNEQYKEEAYAIVRDVPEGLLPVKKGQVIARSGNTGGSAGPHLHFELRRDGRTINPLRFGLSYTDGISPTLRGIRLYPLGGTPIALGKETTVNVDGPFYLGVYATDAAEGSTARNGVDRIEVHVDGSLFFLYTTEGFPLEENSRTVNALVDYDHLVAHREAYLLTRALPGAEGEWIPVRQGDGILRFKPGTTHRVQVRVYDIKDNLAERTFTVRCTGNAPTPAAPTAGMAVKYNEPFHHAVGNVSVDLPAGSLYADDRLLLTPGDTVAIEPLVNALPPHLWYTLALRAPKTHPKAVVVRLDKGKMNAYRTTRESDWLTAKVRDFGRFTLALDTVAPTVRPANFTEGKPLKSTTLKIKIADNLSGIDTYRCTLNGSWVLAEYDGKSAALVINTAGKLKAGRNELTAEVADAAGNKTTTTWTITK